MILLATSTGFAAQWLAPSFLWRWIGPRTGAVAWSTVLCGECGTCKASVCASLTLIISQFHLFVFVSQRGPLFGVVWKLGAKHKALGGDDPLILRSHILIQSDTCRVQ